jgi:hypothetical protein
MKPPKRRKRILWLASVMLLGFGPLLTTASAQSYLYNQTALGVGNNPSSVAAADLNGDGILDFVVTNQTDNTFSVLLSKPNGTFAPKVDYKVGNAPLAIVSGDFNGDHIPDLAIVNSQDGTVSVLLGMGDGTFSAQVPYSSGTLPIGIVAADFNGDHKLDLAVANQTDGTVSLLLGNGDGTFQAQTAITTVSNPIALATGDFNGDRAPDLVALSANGNLSLLLNNGTGGFTPSVVSAGSSGGGLAVGDFNNDGNLDIVATAPDNGALFILIGNGSGGFQQLLTNMTSPGLPFAVATGDFNHDGKLDLAVALGNDFPSSIAILLGEDDGTFQAPVINGVAGHTANMVVGDFNNDNYLDVAVLTNIENEVILLLGQGNGTLGGHLDVTLPASGGIAGGVVADFNGDGKLDAAVTQYNQNGNTITGFISMLPGNGDGTFQPPVVTQVPGVGINQIVTGDFNHDGKIDIANAGVPATGAISVVLGNGDGAFGNAIANPVNIPGLLVQNMISGDFNNDGKSDLALLELSCGNACSPLYMLLSNGDGTFQPINALNLTDFAPSLTAADFNHDGNLDVAVADPQGAVNPSVYIALGRGDGTFASPTSYSTGSLFTNDVKAADFNRDGEIDLAVATEQGIFFFPGKGDGTFGSPVETPMPFSVIRAEIGDFNGDGKLDLAMTGNGDLSVAIALGNGDGTFRAPIPIEATYYPRGLFTAGDFNADGSFDLMQFDSSDTLQPSPQTATEWPSTPTIAFSAAMLNLTSQGAGTPGAATPIVLTNVGNAPLRIAKIAATGNFTEADNCASPMPIGRGCTANVTFTPAANGASNGSITFADNFAPGTQILPLTGWAGAPDFSMSVAPNSSSIIAGGTAPSVLALNSGGGFSGTVQLTCTGAPSKATCTLSSSSVALDGTAAANVNVTVTTTAPSDSAFSGPRRISYPESPFAAICIVGLGMAATLLIARRHRIGAIVGTVVLLLMISSCGGGGTGGGGGTISGTPAGTYTLTVSGTGGNLAHTSTITLTVN